MDPPDIRVFPEPGQLTFGVPAGIRLNIGNGLIEGGLSVKILEYLFISNGLERVMVAIRQEPFHFFDQPLFDHAVYTVMDPVVQRFLGEVNANFENAKGAMPGCTAAKAEDRPARGETDFERAQQSLRVVPLSLGEEGGIMEANFFLQPADAIEIILLLEPAPDGRIASGDLIETIGERLNIKSGATDHDGNGMLAKYFR